ncbi:putative aminophospholipid-translocase [Dipsacomyces acuminosporus]|nr:putative aminophospholipid-translocase [Dipsacomyces acuminosporus]
MKRLSMNSQGSSIRDEASSLHSVDTPLMNADADLNNAVRISIQDTASAVNFDDGNSKGKDKSRTEPLNPLDNSFKKKYPANVVSNNKYNFITFIPLVLFEQFKFFFNLYFLLVALSQFVPQLRIGYLVTYVGPLAFVLLVTMAKEWHDDHARKKRDNEANSQKYVRLTADGRKVISSAKIRVGDLIVIEKNQRVPADMVLLKTTESSGACFVRTDQLDGETDWKLRIAVPPTQKLAHEMDLFTLHGSVYADAPHKDIYDFIGNLTVDHGLPGSSASITTPLGVENTMWANTTLASGTAVGYVVYTGKDTRAAMNTGHAKTKVGILDTEVNRLSKILFLVTLAISLAMVALDGFKAVWYITMFRFLILFSTIIPISLRVNLDMGKSFYSMAIERDKEIPGAVVRNSMIPEELGRVEYCLTDKTGTLTRNEMELKRIHMGVMAYTVETSDEVTRHVRNNLKDKVLAEPDAEAGSSATAASGNLSASGQPDLLVPAGSRAPALALGHGKARRDMPQRVFDMVESLALCHNTLRTLSDCCVIIDGDSLRVTLDFFRDEFIELAVGFPAVVCCRCSPTQKADIVRLIRRHTKKRVLSVGDGGNDVSMIQAADVGVGLVGKEGKQASLAADFSVHQFYYLGRLLLWHGRNSYKRSAKLSQFVIHRGLIISIMQAVFSALFYFAPIALFQGMLLVGYSTIYTMAPVFSLVLDRDITEDIAMLYPELYAELTKGRSLSYKTFFTWLLISIYQGGALMMIAVWLFDTEFVHVVSIAFTGLVLNELLMVALEIRTWHRLMIWSILGSLAIYIASIWVLPAYFDISFILSGAFVWKTLVITAVSSVPLYIIKLLKRIYAPPSYAKLT